MVGAAKNEIEDRTGSLLFVVRERVPPHPSLGKPDNTQSIMWQHYASDKMESPCIRGASVNQ